MRDQSSLRTPHPPPFSCERRLLINRANHKVPLGNMWACRANCCTFSGINARSGGHGRFTPQAPASGVGGLLSDLLTPSHFVTRYEVIVWHPHAGPVSWKESEDLKIWGGLDETRSPDSVAVDLLHLRTTTSDEHPVVLFSLEKWAHS